VPFFDPEFNGERCLKNATFPYVTEDGLRWGDRSQTNGWAVSGGLNPFAEKAHLRRSFGGSGTPGRDRPDRMTIPPALAISARELWYAPEPWESALEEALSGRSTNAQSLGDTAPTHPLLAEFPHLLTGSNIRSD
jgi:hypothetical protein